MNRDQDLFSISRSFLFDVDNVGSENKLFINGFVEGCVSGSSGVQILEPLGQGVLDFNIMSFDLSL